MAQTLVVKLQALEMGPALNGFRLLQVTRYRAWWRRLA